MHKVWIGSKELITMFAEKINLNRSRSKFKFDVMDVRAFRGSGNVNKTFERSKYFKSLKVRRGKGDVSG